MDEVDRRCGCMACVAAICILAFSFMLRGCGDGFLNGLVKKTRPAQSLASAPANVTALCSSAKRVCNLYIIFMPPSFFPYRSFMQLCCTPSPRSTTPDRVTTGVAMSVSLNAIKTSGIRNTVASLQFVVGQDEEGHWVVVESQGRGGGIFINREAALKYAAFETGQRPDAVRCSNKPLAFWR